MSGLQAQRSKIAVYQRGKVAYRKCAAPIPVYKLNALADEFSVWCPRSGDRGFYAKRTIVVEELPERRKKPPK